MPPIHHLGYAVADLGIAAQQWHQLTGIGPFLAFGHMRFDAVSVSGQPAAFDHSAAFAAHGPVFVELQEIHLVEPAGAVPVLVPPAGHGLNHVAYAYDDPAAESARLAAAGLAPTLDARIGDIHVRWHDTVATLGFSVELHQAGEALDGFFDAVTAAARGWDGRRVLQVVG
jgi:Glyoxalase/Bleomycin resistance protein/Dioxygenase superfamily